MQDITEQDIEQVTDEIREARKAVRAAGARIERAVINTDQK